MPRFARYLLTLLLVLGLSHRAVAQNGVPKITVMQTGTKEFLGDLKYIVQLAGKKGKDQWPVIEQTLQVFLGGIDEKLRIRVDVLTGGKDTEIVMHIPIGKKAGNNFAAFRNNLGGFGFAIKKQPANLYKLTLPGKPPQNFWMRYQNGYASIAEKQARLPANAPAPGLAIADLAKRGFDVAANLENDANGQAARKKQFQNIRKNLTDALKQKKGEDKADFQLRKLTLDHQLNELERFYVQSQSLIMGWTTDVEKKEGRLDIELKPIKDSDLDKSVKLFGDSPSYFVNLERSKDAILSVRGVHPLDEMRKSHLLEFYKLVRPNIKSKVDKIEKRSDDEKTAGKEIVDLVLDMLVDGTNGGVVDGFIEVTQTDGKNTVLGGINTPNGEKAIDVMKLVSKADTKLTVKLNLDKQGEVSIHSVSIPENDKVKVQEFLGPVNELYAGISKDSLWIAAGDKALDTLKAAIAKVHEPKKDGAKSVALETFLKLGPWIKYLDKRRQRLNKENSGKKLSATERKQREERDKRRQDAINAFEKGMDIITFKLQRVDDHIEGQLKVYEGIFRFVGNEIAKFSEETLQ